MLSAVVLSSGHQIAQNGRQAVRIYRRFHSLRTFRKKCLRPKTEAVLFGTTAHLEEEPPADRKAQVQPVRFRSTDMHISLDTCQSVNDSADFCPCHGLIEALVEQAIIVAMAGGIPSPHSGR